ncbi:alpha-L-fucosidase [Streptomyces sp. 8N114]|uniref:alpha-L-fucosidase n=1 Tax=Streptomyces sp. 8N114 TaxID=3457419 RepID=UPI003FD40462
MTEHMTRRRVLAGMAAMTAAASVTPTLATPAFAATQPLPLLPPRVPQGDMGIEQQPDEKIQWMQDAKLGMFIHWGVYAGPAKGEWHMENDAITPDNYKKYLTDASDTQFTASAYNPADWAQLAKDMGAAYSVLTTRHHDGLALWPTGHPNAWHSGQEPLKRDFIDEYVKAVRNAGLKVGLYYSPINWRYPGYYDWNGTGAVENAWGYTTDPAHKENARVMKNEVYQSVRELVTKYGKIDDIWWDGGWLGQQGTDRDSAFFWEPGKLRDTSNDWKVDAAYSETDPATGRPLGLMGMVRKHQPDIIVNTRSSWMGDYTSYPRDEGPGVPSGAVRTTELSEKAFTLGGSWGYSGDEAMDFGQAVNILVNCWVRNMTCLVNVGPDRTGKVPDSQVALARKIGSFMDTYGKAVYGTRGGPWNPEDGKYGFTHKENTFYIHLLPGYSGTEFITPSTGDAKVKRVFDVASGGDLRFSVDGDGQVKITGIDRGRTPEDSVVGVELDRSVQPANIAVGAKATASSEEINHGNTAAKAVDGSTATRWAAANGSSGQWLTVDLGAPKSLTGTRIVWELDKKNYRYKIEGSHDNANWSTLADLTGTDSTRQVQTAQFKAQARYVRVTVTGPSGTWASIRSLEVYDRPFSTSLAAAP